MAQTTAGSPPPASPPRRKPNRERPDSRPARLMMGAGALAAVTVIGAGLVDYPLANAEEQTTTQAPAASTVAVERPVRYVRLKPGQKAPKGARVIREAAPTPRIVVRRVVTSPAKTSTRTVARSRQSGR